MKQSFCFYCFSNRLSSYIFSNKKRFFFYLLPFWIFICSWNFFYEFWAHIFGLLFLFLLSKCTTFISPFWGPIHSTTFYSDFNFFNSWFWFSFLIFNSSSSFFTWLSKFMNSFWIANCFWISFFSILKDKYTFNFLVELLIFTFYLNFNSVKPY